MSDNIDKLTRLHGRLCEAETLLDDHSMLLDLILDMSHAGVIRVDLRTQEIHLDSTSKKIFGIQNDQKESYPLSSIAEHVSLCDRFIFLERMSGCRDSSFELSVKLTGDTQYVDECFVRLRCRMAERGYDHPTLVGVCVALCHPDCPRHRKI